MLHTPDVRQLGVAGAYLALVALVIGGLVPIWCLAVLLTLPAGLRLVRRSGEAGRQELRTETRRWIWLFAFQVAVGYAIDAIVR